MSTLKLGLNKIKSLCSAIYRFPKECFNTDKMSLKFEALVILVLYMLIKICKIKLTMHAYKKMKTATFYSV